jgi:flagellar motor protein MotB
MRIARRSWSSRTGLSSLALLVVSSFSAVGCQNAVHDQNLALHRQNNELQGRVRQLESENQQLSQTGQQTASLQTELQARDARIAELEGQLRQPTAGVSAPGIEGIETTYDAKAGTMTVNVPGDVLFGSGLADVKPSAQATLDKIIAALKKDYAGRPIRVEGHTDSDPITRTKGQWTDNLDLSLNRAAAVTRYLEQKGIDAKLITTSGFGATKPRGADKAKNRRVEIVVITR